MLNDLRYALRMLVKSPGFTVVAVLTLALGIGANTAIFSVVNSALIEPLPYPNPSQLVYVQETSPDGRPNGRVSGGAFKDWREHSSTFAHLAVYEDAPRNLTGLGAPERLSGLQVSAEFLPAWGVVPIVGRGFAAGEDSVGANNRVVVLSHEFWQSHFGGDTGVLGRKVLLDQVPYTVIGVLPAHALLQDDAMFLIPDVIDAPGVEWGRAGHWREVIGRLKPGVATAGAEAELRTIRRRLASEYPSFKKDWSVGVAPMQEVYAGNTRPLLTVLLVAVALVLLIACANVANLLLARGNSRSREMAVRAALGARSSRIVRQMLTESMLLALAGCAFGLLFAFFCIRLLGRTVAEQLPQIMHPHLDTNVLAFSLLVACGCGALFGMLPAWRAGKSDVNQVLKETERGSMSASKKRSQSFLVVSEFALTLVLLIGAGLLLRSFVRLLDTDPGFNPKHTLAFDLTFPKTKYPDAETQLRFVKNLSGRIAALPGVEFAGSVSGLPLSKRGDTEYVSRGDRPERMDYLANCNFVSGDYFPALGIRLLSGRAIVEADNSTAAARVLVIDSSIARDLYPGEEPIGRFLRFQGESWEIVGLVAPVRHFGLDLAPRPNIYMPQARYAGSTSMILRTALPPLTLVDTVRKVVLNADPDQPIANVRTLEQAIHKSLAPRQTTLVLLGPFAALAAGLACIGIYGVVSYAIGQRARELSIRSALGARPRDVARLVLRGGMKLSALGIAGGLLAGFALVRLLESQLFEVKAHDPLVFIASVSLLGIMAAVSVYLPARRAAKVDPMAALRCE